MSQTIVVTGAGGRLGAALVRQWKSAQEDVIGLNRLELDLTRPNQIRDILENLEFGVLVNCAAQTAVDRCETHFEEAKRINAQAVREIAEICDEKNARCIHVSTDYVFGAAGPGPFPETAPPAPLSAYGASKLAGEHLVLAAAGSHLVIRTSGLYGVRGSRGKGGNFVETMLRLVREGRPIRVVDDQVLAPTPTADLAEATARLLAVGPPGGIYHLTSAGACSWFEFAGRIFALAGLAPALTPISSATFGARTARSS